MTPTQRLRIEQAIARGDKPSQILTVEGITYRSYRLVVESMDAMLRLEPASEAEAVALSMGRSLSSCYGPAPAEVIARLVDELNPRKSSPGPRKRDAIGRYETGRKKVA